MRKSKSIVSMVLCFSLFIGMLPSLAVFASTGPSITGLTPFTYKEREAPVLVAPNIVITGGGQYDDGYVRFGITGSTPTEKLSLRLETAPITTAGVVSVVTDAVYLGDGTSAKQIGSVNSTENGTQGKNLKIDFSTPLVNGEFEDNGGSSNGWTINKNRVVMGALASKTQGGPVTISGTGPYTINGSGYSFQTDFNYSAGTAAWRFEGDERPLRTGTYNSEIYNESGNHSLRLYFSGNIDSANYPNSGTYGSSFGPETISSPFTASAGDTLAFDWKAANGGDDYEVYGFLYNVDTNAYTELMYGRGYQQSWITAPGVIPADGTYQFRFVTGSYDRTGGYAVGASLYIDKVRVFGNSVNDDVVQQISRLVTYENTSSTPELSRTINVETRTKNGDTATETSTVTVTPKYTLVYTPGANGTITGSLSQDIEVGQSGAPVTAVPDSGYRFIGWSDGVQTATRTDVGPGDITATAYFSGTESAIAPVETTYTVDNHTNTISPNTSDIDRTVTVGTFLQNLTKNESSEWKVIPTGTDVQDAAQFDGVTGKDNSAQLELGDKLAVKAADGTITVYTIVITSGFAGGTGTVNDPFQISTAEHLSNIRYGLDKHYKLTSTVSLAVYSAGEGWEPIGTETNKFTGTFDGNGFTISNLTVNRPTADHVGLFGYTQNASISNVGLEGTNVTGKDHTGRLIGQANNTVITNSYVTGTVTGAVYTGGMIGTSDNTIILNSYGAGAVSGTDETGGLVGQATGGTVVSSYYDSVTAGQSDDSGKGTPKTTAEMMQQATFQNWDFGGVWTINEGSGYPVIMPRAVISVTAPSGAILSGASITAVVPNSTNTITVNVIVSPGASWSLYGDSAATQEITNKTMDLVVGANTAYVKVTARDGVTSTVYTLTINRSARAANNEPETIVVDVDGGKGDAVSKATITRTTMPNGTVKDTVTFTADNAKEAVSKLTGQGLDTARIVIPDTNDKVSETVVNVPRAALDQLASGKANLEIFTANGRISIPYSSFSELGEDLYFRIVPIKSEKEKNEVVERVKREEMVQEIVQDKTAQVLGRPMVIETNMESQPVSILLPLYDRLPNDPAEREKILKNLVIFIEHDDGTKEVVKGIVTNYAKSDDLGIEFGIDKFSTFTMVYMEGWEAYFAALQEKEKEASMHKAYMYGYPDGTFRPEKGITRAEMAAILSRVGPVDEKQADHAAYPDVPATHWAKSYIEKAKTTGLMRGYNDGTFAPQKEITRAEMAVIVAGWLKLEGKGKTNLTDIQGHWGANYIALVDEAGAMKGTPDGKFEPNKPLSRAEAVATINRILKKSPLTGLAKASWSDVVKTHWAFADIEEASKDHEANLHGKK